MLSLRLGELLGWSKAEAEAEAEAEAKAEAEAEAEAGADSEVPQVGTLRKVLAETGVKEIKGLKLLMMKELKQRLSRPQPVET